MTDDIDLGLLFDISDGVTFVVHAPPHDGIAAALPGWMAQALEATQAAEADYGVVVCKRARREPPEWWAYLRADDFLSLHGRQGRLPGPRAFPLRMTLAEAVAVLRAAGYGDEPTEAAA